MSADAEELRSRMVAGLLERGELSAQWRPAFEQVARHRFIPEVIYRWEPTGDCDLVPVARADEPQWWLTTAYANAAVKTQVDDGRPGRRGRGRELSSSVSQPAVVAEMLTALQVEPGMRVLEIGTGSGYSAALMAYVLGGENVVSLEVDPALAEHARERLAAEGYGKVTVITGDGADGWSEAAPYDRVIATVAAYEVPPAWVAQTRSGGEILVPWGTSWYPSSLLRLTAHPDRIASGRIIGSAHFMELRTQRQSRRDRTALLGAGEARTSTTTLHPHRVAGRPASATAIGFRMGQVEQFYAQRSGEKLGRLNLTDQPSGSWARVQLADEPPYTVEQAGPRQLWDDVKAAYQWWCEQGEPSVEDWQVTVGPQGQRITLDPVAPVLEHRGVTQRPTHR